MGEMAMHIATKYMMTPAHNLTEAAKKASWKKSISTALTTDDNCQFPEWYTVNKVNARVPAVDELVSLPAIRDMDMSHLVPGCAPILRSPSRLL